MRAFVFLTMAVLVTATGWSADDRSAERKQLEQQLKQAVERRKKLENEAKNQENAKKRAESDLKTAIDRAGKGRENLRKQLEQQVKNKEAALERLGRDETDNEKRTQGAQEDLKKVVARREELKRRFESRANDKQLQNQDLATRKQAELNATIDILRKALAEDEARLEKLAQENRQENELVFKDAAPMQMVEAFELAKQLESEITESYKDIKATETAISRKMSFKAAERITDVAKPERIQANVEAIELKPRNKEDLDRQKQAQKEVVLEADTMLEASVKLMEDAMEIVMAKKEEIGPHQKSKQIKWLEEKDFEQQQLEEKIAQMEQAAEFQVEMDKAAAEDESRKAKDLAALMNQLKADQLEEANGPKADLKAGQPPPLVGGEKWLQPGNVAAVGGEPPDGKAIPAKWMFISSWYVLGPFPNPDRVNLRRKFPPESVIDLDATYAGKDGKTLKWTFAQAHNVDTTYPWGGKAKNAAEVFPPDKQEYAIYYAYAEVFFDRECDRWVAIGSDDRSDVWVNDFHIWGSSNKLKCWSLNEDYRRVHFKQGRNRILLRCENGHLGVGWSMCIALEEGSTKL